MLTETNLFIKFHRFRIIQIDNSKVNTFSLPRIRENCRELTGLPLFLLPFLTTFICKDKIYIWIDR